MKALLLLALPALLGAQDPSSAATEKPRLAKEVLLKAIQDNAPILVPHGDELYQVTSVESFLAVSEPYGYQEGGKGYRGLRLKGAPVPGLMGIFSKDTRAKGGDPKNAKVYINVKVGKETTDLQYWFLYAFNGPGSVYFATGNALPKVLPAFLTLNQLKKTYSSPNKPIQLQTLGIHEGDWEHLTVRISNVDGQRIPDKAVFMSAHGDGGWYPERSVLAPDLKGKGSRIWAFASKNGHALFTTPDVHLYSQFKSPITGLAVFALVNDTSKLGGQALTVDFGLPLPGGKGSRLEIMGVQGDPALVKALGFTPPAWIAKYPDRWGRYVEKPVPLENVPGLKTPMKQILDKLGLLTEMTLEAGPQPPWKKGIWDKEDE